MPIRAGDPRTHAELTAAFHRVRAEELAFWRELPLATFASRIGEKWSPAENVRHLAIADRAVIRGFRAPVEVLVARFGAPDRPSRSFLDIANEYVALGNRLVAPPAFHPEADDAARDEAWRERVLADGAAAANEWLDAFTAWPDEALDRARMPHPLMGALTMREFAGWVVHHHAHHANTVERLLAASR